jgi:hypothetical protein
MNIQVPTSLLTRLYDGAPTAVVISSEQRFRALLPGLPVRLLLAAADGTSQSVRLLEEMAPAADWQAITVPPSVWCIWVLDDSAGNAEGNHQLRRTLQDWWRKHGGDDAVPDLRTGSAAEFGRHLLSHAVGEMTGLQRRNRDLLGSVSALRDELAHGTRIPPEITELLENLRLSPPRMIFANSPGKAGVTVPRLPENGEAGSQGCPVPVLAQRLPAWARGLSGIDLHVANTPVGSGTLLLSLYAVDAAKRLANWHIPYAELVPGWMPLRLPVALDQFHRALELRVCGIGAAAEPLHLSVAPVGLAEEFALGQVTDAADEAATPLDTADKPMLAMRLWGGLPGIAYDPAHHLAAHPLPSILQYPLPEDIVANARSTRECEAKFPWFGYLPKGKILLHPLPRQVVAARIAVPAGLPLVTATCDVAIEDQRCRTPIACKLVAAGPGVPVDQAEREEGILASSGWTTIESPLRPFPLTAPFGDTWNGPVYLHLFTRITDGSPGHYGRTVFNRFSLEIDARSAGGSHPPYPGTPEP